MNSRQIIINLIDKQLINGEEAFTLINDVIQSEILESWKALNNKENKDLYNTIPSWTNNKKITWTYANDGLTAGSGTSDSTLASTTYTVKSI